MVSQNGKTGGLLLAGKEGREEVSKARWREFLGTALVLGLPLGITAPLMYHSTTSLADKQVLAEISCHGNKILFFQRGLKWCCKLYKSNGRHASCCKEPILTNE